jgi:hypothetical protein
MAVGLVAAAWASWGRRWWGESQLGREWAALLSSPERHLGRCEAAELGEGAGWDDDWAWMAISSWAGRIERKEKWAKIKYENRILNLFKVFDFKIKRYKHFQIGFEPNSK